jgi:Na+/H+-dicarboxylate symporter/ABC-type amino acid transport substrate-binding protein
MGRPPEATIGADPDVQTAQGTTLPAGIRRRFDSTTGKAMATVESRYAARLPLWVLIGASLGFVAGIFFGDDATVLRPVGTTYVKLMQVVVFPYIICSLLHGLGRLSPSTAWRLFRCSWIIYLAVWGLTFLVIFLMSLAIPPVPPPSFIDARTASGFLDLPELLIPANPFLDLARNHLPAIVIFSIVYGIAIQRVKDKEAFLSFLDLIRSASVTIWGWVVLLAPFGVFALFADTAGTLEPSALENLSIYLLASVLGTLILAFWILPSVIAAACPMTTREIIADLRSALIISVVTTLSVAALPYIQQAAQKLAAQADITDPNRDEIINTSLAVSYPLAQLGNFFIWLFILFAAFYYRIPIPAGDQVALPFISLLSGFGSPSSSIDAVAFLAQWLDLPSNATSLYVGMMTITRYGQVVVSVMGFAFVTYLVTMNYYGRLKLRLPRLALALGVGAAVAMGTAFAVDTVRSNVIHGTESPYLTYRLDADTTRGVSVAVDRKDGTPSSGSSASTSALARIQASGEIRIGFNPDIIPFSYRNDRGELVGFDIAHAYQLARDLNVRLRLVPFTWDGLATDLDANRFDMAASGIFVTNQRLEHFAFSEPYLKSPIALIVHARDARQFLSRAEIEARTDLTFAVFRDPVMTDLINRIFPAAKVVVLPNYDELPEHPEIDAAIWTLAQAKAWTAPRADYTAVVPKDLGGELLIAYLMPKASEDLRSFVNYWLRIQHVNGFNQRMIEHWIDGRPDAARKQRWSIVRQIEDR